MLNLKTLLGIDDLTEFNIKLDNIDQFGIDTNTLFALNHDRLLQEIGFLHDSNRKRKTPGFNYVMDRKYTIHFIPYDLKNKLWLFVGVFIQPSTYEVEKDGVTTTFYNLIPVSEFDEVGLNGRLIMKMVRPTKSQHFRFRLEDSLEWFTLNSILERKIDTKNFNGYENVCLTYPELKGIISNGNPSWRTALGNLNAVYLQVDKETGKQYVGAAYGEQKLWGRWTNYVDSYHGGNKGLRALYEEKGGEYFEKNFIYTILEIFSNKTLKAEVIERENWWKEILRTRDFGYNEN